MHPERVTESVAQLSEPGLRQLLLEQYRLDQHSVYRLHTPVPHGQEQELLAPLYPGKRVILPKQPHGTAIRDVNRFDSLLISGCDGLITQDEEVVVAAKGADCPVITASYKGIRGIMHSGWKGTVEGAPAALIRAMRQSRAKESEITVQISPGIRFCCYEIPLADPRDRVGQFETVYPDLAVIYQNSRITLNLQRAIRASLLSEGIDPDKITTDVRCTCCDSKQFPSHYREGQQRTTSLIVTLSHQEQLEQTTGLEVESQRETHGEH